MQWEGERGREGEREREGERGRGREGGGEVKHVPVGKKVTRFKENYQVTLHLRIIPDNGRGKESSYTSPRLFKGRKCWSIAPIGALNI